MNKQDVEIYMMISNIFKNQKNIKLKIWDFQWWQTEYINVLFFMKLHQNDTRVIYIFLKVSPYKDKKQQEGKETMAIKWDWKANWEVMMDLGTSKKAAFQADCGGKNLEAAWFTPWNPSYWSRVGDTKYLWDWRWSEEKGESETCLRSS